MMPEYIEKEALINSFKSSGGYTVYGKKYVDAIVSRINTLPVISAVDAVEVTRCRNCKHCERVGKHFVCNEWWEMTEPNDFCSKAERRCSDE